MRAGGWTGRLASRPGSRSTAPIVCSFCGRPQAPGRPVVAGPTPRVAICRDCVELCAEMFAEARG